MQSHDGFHVDLRNIASAMRSISRKRNAVCAAIDYVADWQCCALFFAY